MPAELMTERQALRAMFFYLEERWSRVPETELGALLGELLPTAEGEPFDQAVIGDWHQAARKAMEETK